MINPEVSMTLEEAVKEVLGNLTGLDLEYEPELDRFRSVTRALNRALRATALDEEWAHYASVQSLGPASVGTQMVYLPSSVRPRIIDDDAVRLVDGEGSIRCWAYFLPRDALHKYQHRAGLWCAITGQVLQFSRPFLDVEDALDIQAPVMREPVMFRLPETGEGVPDHILKQEVDFAYPDLVIARAAYFYAQTDPVMQPRVQTLEMDYKTLMYQLIEREQRHTDSPHINEFVLPLANGLRQVDDGPHHHPHSNY